MTRLKIAMPQNEMGPGEAADRTRSRRTFITFAVLSVLGGAVGFTAALIEPHEATLTTGGSLPAWFAILAALLLIGAVTAGSLVYYRTIDELQRLDNYWAATMGANVLLMAYPVWLILWKGGLVPAPDAMTLYLAVLVSTGLAYAWRKLR
ncbi:hypothetical protein [Sphingomonas sp. 10B4]|uniref:hypothetical protein n=1 Tax=Sphingomonas sp. 10B4 TaxID=3048575 RepID=UPI002AB571A7|nr:hypothetical protein [Sphingomonas sp. 10B4]MDY7523028.1 hypothetical protein [Sphingomonas sp. 10B4]MEB0282806.1 hypothetical protein [Sphingomonas sp. 10B4]